MAAGASVPGFIALGTVTPEGPRQVVAAPGGAGGRTLGTFIHIWAGRGCQGCSSPQSGCPHTPQNKWVPSSLSPTHECPQTSTVGPPLNWCSGCPLKTRKLPHGYHTPTNGCPPGQSPSPCECPLCPPTPIDHLLPWCNGSSPRPPPMGPPPCTAAVGAPLCPPM